MKANSCKVENNTPSKIMIVISLVLIIIYTFFINHIDCNTIVTWGYDLLESVRNGAFWDFPMYTLNAHGMPTNYTLFSNVINAIFLSPVYIIDVLFNLELSMVFYDIFYKVIIGAVAVVSIIVFNKSLEQIGYDLDRRNIATFLMATSSILLIAVLGKGQIDIFDLLLVVLAIYSYTNNRIQLSFLCIGIGCLFKPFVILLGVPYLCLMVGKCRAKSLLNAVLLVLPYIFDNVITNALMPEYGKGKMIAEEIFSDMSGESHLEKIFDIRINNIYVFILLAIIVCGICLYIGIENKCKRWHLPFFTTIVFVIYGVFVEATALYWYVIIIPLLIIMGLGLSRIQDLLIFNLVVNISVPILFVYMEEILIPGINYSVLDSLCISTDIYPFMENLSYIRYHKGVWATVLVGCIILLCIEYAYEKKIKGVQLKGQDILCIGDENIFTKILIFAQALPALLYVVMVYVMY